MLISVVNLILTVNKLQIVNFPCVYQPFINVNSYVDNYYFLVDKLLTKLLSRKPVFYPHDINTDFFITANKITDFSYPIKNGRMIPPSENFSDFG